MFIPLTYTKFQDQACAGRKWDYKILNYFALYPQYQVHTIKKKTLERNLLVDGTETITPKIRVIHEPCPALKKIQEYILNMILNPAADMLLPCAHGCVPGRSTVTNARPHVGATLWAHMDIKDFFPSISTQRVYGLFLNVFKYEKDLAWLLAHLTTYQGRLPQGAPTSPMIANFIAFMLDCDLTNFCKRWGVAYTRYVDDLTFSIRRYVSRRRIGRFLTHVRRTVSSNGFRVNPEKTSVISKKNRKCVTGVVVNTHVSCPKSFRKNLRAALHKHGKGDPTSDPWTVIEGRLAYVRMISQHQYHKLSPKIVV